MHTKNKCECELPGYWYSGIPGILAKIVDGKVIKGTVVERCDLCKRYKSDKEALEKLKNLNML